MWNSVGVREGGKAKSTIENLESFTIVRPRYVSYRLHIYLQQNTELPLLCFIRSNSISVRNS